jgi:hypothetical protein
MGLTYSFTFSAAASVTAAELERFLKSVEADAKRMGFGPTLVLGATFKTSEQGGIRPTHSRLVAGGGRKTARRRATTQGPSCGI